MSCFIFKCTCTFKVGSYFDGCILFYTKIEYGGLMGFRVDHFYSTGLFQLGLIF